MDAVNDSSAIVSASVEQNVDSLVAVVADVFEVHSVRRQQPGLASDAIASRGGVAVDLIGRFRVPSEEAYRLVAPGFKRRGYVATFRPSADGDVITAVPGELPSEAGKPWLAGLMFLATLLSVLWVGSGQVSFENGLPGLLSGWPFAVSLLAILGAHEFGHYLASRRYGVVTSLPYFIPMPFSLLGTLGAFIRMKSPPHNRRELLAIAAAGPLAGLAVALPLLVLGLKLSKVEVIPPGAYYFQEGNSLLYAGLKMLVFGRFLPGGGEDVLLHPVAMAGWTGLLVTALNLIPAGQLDGGHIAYVLLGERAKWLTWAVVAMLLALSVLWSGWLLWAALVYIFGRAHAVPLDDVTRLTMPQRVLVIAMLVIFALVFIPIPLSVS